MLALPPTRPDEDEDAGKGGVASGSGGVLVPRRWLIIGAAATILLAVAAMLVGKELVSSPSAPPKPTPKRSSAAPAGLVRFTDPVGRFSISYPPAWRRLMSRDSQVRLLAARDAASVLVRTQPLGTPVGPESLGAAKKLTDNLVRSAGTIKLLNKARQVTLGGLSGYLYLYTFKDSAAAGQLVAHAHYFLFRGETLLTVVFQAQPADRFAALVPLFDRIAATFRAQPS